MERGLEILAKVKKDLGLPVLTDVHSEAEIAEVAKVVDVLQTPAFLCRQTDFIRAVAQSGKPVNIKKGQFLAPGDMKNVIDKARAAAKEKGLPEDSFMACERGASFGYNNLVSDMRSLAIMRETGAPVVFDATHSVQLPGGQGTSSGGQREMVPVLARAAVAVGVAGLFMETHPDPAKALSDGPNAVPLKHMKALLETLLALDRVTKKNGFLENSFGAWSHDQCLHHRQHRRYEPEQYEELQKARLPIAMKAHGAEVCVRGGKVEVLEGDWNPARLVMLKFPSMEQATGLLQLRRIRSREASAARRCSDAHDRRRRCVIRFNNFEKRKLE